MKVLWRMIVSMILAGMAGPLGAEELVNPAKKGEQSVRPGINEKFLDPDLKVEEWLKRFEVESREVFLARKEVLAACEVQKGMVVADIGAGTGLYTRMFSEAVGPRGWVCALEINGNWLEHIVKRAGQEGQENITAILCAENSVTLPPVSVDVAFVCDTYHHFEYPVETLRSLMKSLKSGGTLVVVDFERVEGKSREWVLGHVRAGKEVFRKEIEDAGFVFVEEVKIPSFEENYFLRFRKK